MLRSCNESILVTRFTKHSKEWADATYYNVRTGEPCRITTGEAKGKKNFIPVRSYRSVVNAYVNNAETKFNGPDGKQCGVHTRGVLQRMHVIVGQHLYCGKEMKRKLEQGPLDHDVDSKVKVYANGRVTVADSVKSDMGRMGVRELMRRGIGQHTIEKALHSTIRSKTFAKLVKVIEIYQQENRSSPV